MVQFKLGYTPLHWAVAKGRWEVAEILLAARANPNAKDNVTLPHTLSDRQ